MPTGPQGQKRPRDPARNALKILKIATGEIEEDTQLPEAKARGHARAQALTQEHRSAIAKKAAMARWHKAENITEQ